MNTSRSRIAIPLAFLALVAGSLAVAGDTPRDPELDALLSRFDRAQAAVRTLSADFTETTASIMLKEPIVATGHLYLTKPDSIRWEYSLPEQMRFVIASDVYTGYFPERKRAEKRNIHRWSDQLFRFIGLGQQSSELERMYDIRLDEASDFASTGQHLLALEPNKRRARKRIARVNLWVDGTSFLPSAVAYTSRDGNTRRIEFRNVEVNPDLAAALYRMDIPADVEITKGISGLPDLGAAATP